MQHVGAASVSPPDAADTTSPGSASKPVRSRSRKVGQTYVRPHVCSFPGCSKAFTRVEHLRRHQLNHRAAQKWNCQPCGATFVRLDLWQRHRRVTHGEDVVEQSPGTKRRRTSSDRNVDILSSQRSEELSTPSSGQSLDGGAMKNQQLVPPIQAGYGHQTLPRMATDQAWTDAMNARMDTGITPLSNGHGNYGPTGTYAVEPVSTTNDDFLAPDADLLLDPQIDSGIDLRYAALTTSTDLEWLFEGSLSDTSNGIQDIHNVPYGTFLPPDGYPVDDIAAYEHDYGSIIDTKYETESAVPDPSANGSEREPPSCGFRVCNALTPEHRMELLLALQTEIPGLDISLPVFALNNMKQGIHLYCSVVSQNYSMFHHQILLPSRGRDGTTRIIDEVYGEEAPHQLAWAMITLGWTLIESDDDEDIKMAVKIQRALRKSVINHPAFTLSPPLWVVQTLFLVLVFSRYHGSREEFSSATIFHGVLIDAVRRLDLRGRAHFQPNLDAPSHEALKVEWFKWIKVETMKRLVFQAFVLDVQHTILHGGDISMSPFELNMRLPYCEEAWFAETAGGWRDALLTREPQEPPMFLPMLKQFWNCQNPGALFSGDSKVILYGITSIACEMRRRDENTFFTRPSSTRDSSHTASALSNRVLKALEGWIVWWRTNTQALGEVYPWRNCACAFRLAHTLYEIGPVELQTLAGKEVIEGKRIGNLDYSRAKRKIRGWARTERAGYAVAHAADLVRERLTPGWSGRAHCQHCHWCVYLAGLVCWTFGFALTGSVGEQQQLIQGGRLISHEAATRQCDEYLAAMSGERRLGVKVAKESGATKEDMALVGRTTGVLVRIIEVLGAEDGGLIEESVEVLNRLVGIRN